MKLTQVKGNTWVAEGIGLIPLYLLDGKRCILLDTGLKEEQDELEQALLTAGLTPVGILCSHAHVDHCGNNGYFQEKYNLPVALTVSEAGMCSSVLNLKCYCLVVTPQMAEEEMASMVHTPDVIIPAQDGPMDFAGATFQIVQTPGHSSGHISTITPDNVCYTADAILSYEFLKAKLPYSLSHKLAHSSREKLRNLGCDVYIMAHRGVCPGKEIGPLVDGNNQLIHKRMGEILNVVDHPMTASEINQRVCELYQLLTKRPRRALRFERNIRFYIEYLVDEGILDMCCHHGVTYYQLPQEQESNL